MEFKFEVGQRVQITDDEMVVYLKAGMTATVTKRTEFAGQPEYIIVMDDNEFSDVEAWIVDEECLGAEDAS